MPALGQKELLVCTGVKGNLTSVLRSTSLRTSYGVYTLIFERLMPLISFILEFTFEVWYHGLYFIIHGGIEDSFFNFVRSSNERK
jgi:hypothetical protein